MTDSKVDVNAAVQPPSEFDFSRPELWPTWIKRFERYLSVSNSSKKSKKEKIDLLCYVMGEKSEEIFSQVVPDLSDATTYETVKKKFDEYFTARENVVFERFKFNSRIQQPEESVDSFITALYTLAESCEFGNLKDELIRDRIIIGIRDSRASERLQLISDLTINKTIELARQAEIQAREGKKIRDDVSQQSQVNRVAENKRKGKGSRHSWNDKAESASCTRCGLPKHANWQRCPASSSRCRKCSKLGHWESVCRSKVTDKVNRVEEADDTEEESKETIFLGAVSDVNDCIGDFVFKAHVNKLRADLRFIVDSGADVTCISLKAVPEWYRNRIRSSRKIVLGTDGKRLSLLDYIDVNIVWKKQSVKARIYVLEILKNCLLGKPEIRRFDLIKVLNNLRLQSNQGVNDFIKRYPKVFDGIGQFGRPLKIQLKENIVPFFQSVSRTIALPLREKVKEKLDRLVSKGIITQVDFPTDWCNPIVVVPKKNSASVHICGDYTKLNSSVKQSHFPLAKVDVALASLKGSKYFLKLDAEAGFYQVSKLDKESKKLTTFITPFGRFMFTRLPFRINGAPDYFSQWFADLFVKTEKSSRIKRNRWHLVPAPYRGKEEERSNNAPLNFDVNDDENVNVNVTEPRVRNHAGSDYRPEGELGQDRPKRTCGPPAFYGNVVTH
ncbi:uncharacterized protein K02A2.6-like [Nylanderia fulva]|uniref:uncharacterized protein K02A2.6-like n=1 Tax=Nylanderia fulva TaxID=613905 RepID=UPI0010FB19AA|nr:uncharacterized protein K02A2.6-like [Nylanderia fulva]